MIRIPRLAHLGVFLALFCVAFPFFGAPKVLWFLFVIPIALAYWVERNRTTVSGNGIEARTMFGSRHIDWADVRGLKIPKRGYLRLHLADDTDVTLPAVGYDRLPELVAASDGRIPDPFIEPEITDAADDTADTEAKPDAAAAAPDDSTAKTADTE